VVPKMNLTTWPTLCVSGSALSFPKRASGEDHTMTCYQRSLTGGGGAPCESLSSKLRERHPSPLSPFQSFSFGQSSLLRSVHKISRPDETC
jgi:hypothetical protein